MEGVNGRALQWRLQSCSDGNLLVIGSPGVSIIPYVSNTIVAILDWGMDVQKAVWPHAESIWCV